MMIINDLLWKLGLEAYGSKPEMDPLTESDALMEAQLLDSRIEARTMTAALLFEMRVALQIRECNTGVLVAKGVTEFFWTADRRPTANTAWAVIGSQPTVEGERLKLAIGFAPGATLRVNARSAAFFLGDVPGLAEAPPDYLDEAEEGIQARLPSWTSEFAMHRAVFLGSSPDRWPRG